MKSKKIVALIVAFAAFMAVATSGLAAVTTTTTYSGDKVEVTAVVDAETDKEVTYLVRSSATQIVYIDQQTADENGKATFTYKIAKEKIEDLRTDVSLGTDSATPLTTTGKEITLEGVVVTSDGNVSVVGYFKEQTCDTTVDSIVGNNNVIYVKLKAAEGYNISAVSVEGEAIADFVAANEYVVTLSKGQNVIDVDVVKTETKPVVTKYDVADVTTTVKNDKGELVSAVEKTTLMKVTNAYTKAGVNFNGEFYPALKAGATAVDESSYFTGTDYFAVKLIVPEADANAEITTYVK